MAQITIEQFATELKMPSGALLEQLAAAGVDAKRKATSSPSRTRRACSTTCASSTALPPSRRSASR